MRVRSRISELCQYIGIINTSPKLQILIFIIRIGNLLINSLCGATETFASWFGMAFKRCVLEVTFHVNGLDLTYANIWQTSFTDLYKKTMVASISQKESLFADMIVNWLLAWRLCTVYEMSLTVERHRQQRFRTNFNENILRSK